MSSSHNTGDDNCADSSCSAIEEQKPKKDLSGQSRIAHNVATSWAGYLVFVAAGFVLPRLIDDRLGQASLGVWDFAWCLIAYFGLVQAGIGSSVNRYMAKYLAVGDTQAIRSLVSTVSCFQLCAATIVAILAIVAGYGASFFFSKQLGSLTSEARYVILFVGLGLAVQMAFNVFVGVVTGCHRWDIHNGVSSAGYAVTVITTILVLILGGGLTSVAFVNLCGTLLTEIARAVAAFRIYPELRFRLADVQLSVLKRQLTYGGKAVGPRIAELIINGATNVLIIWALGPAGLALFSRPKALMRHVKTFVAKFGFVLTPTASSLQSTCGGEELSKFFINSSRYGMYISLPMIIGVAIMGGPLLYIWMGPTYANGLLAAAVALGSLPVIIQEPIFSFLSGINAHGRAGLAMLIGSVGSAICVAVALGVFHCGLTGAAIASAIPLMISNVGYVPWRACKNLNIAFSHFVKGACFGPIAATAPFAVCLLAGRFLFSDHPPLALLVGGLSGAAALVVTYWRWVIPLKIRNKLLSRFSFRARCQEA